MVIILMKMILKLLFMTELWLAVIDIKQRKACIKRQMKNWESCITKDDKMWNYKSNA